MHEKVAEFIGQKKKEEQIQFIKEKNELLDELGLCERIYSPTNVYTEEYCCYDGYGRYYKKIPIEVTDEEYEELKKYQSNEENSRGNNITAKVLFVIGIIEMICGFLAGIVFGAEEEEFIITLIWWLAGFFIGIHYIGFSEIIELLQGIKDKK